MTGDGEHRFPRPRGTRQRRNASEMDAMTAAWLTPVVASAPAPIAATTSWTGMASVSGLLLSASIIAALITGTINLTLARRRSREEERARVRNTFAEAFKAYSEYRDNQLHPTPSSGPVALASPAVSDGQ